MPTYKFRNTETGEIYEKVMKISELDSYKQQNPTHETYIDYTTPIADAVRVGARKKDAGFKEVLQRIHEKTPGSQLNQTSSQI
jgi:predicted nucleic acid-binding Zn ribbon protein